MTVEEQLKPGTPPAIIALIEKQLTRAANAAARIEKEGEVVRDGKGSVIQHPALAIETSATKLACDLIAKHKRR